VSFSFIQITDHHLPETEAALVRGFSPAYAFRAVMRHIADNVSSEVDFIVTTGDLIEPASDGAYRMLSHMLGLHADATKAPGPLRISIEGLRDFPMYFLPGNHDDRSLFFHYLFPGTPPAPLMNVAFVHQGVQFICLDLGTESKATNEPTTLDFLGRSLQTGLPSIILTHHQLVSIGSRWLDDFVADDVDRLW